MLPGRLDRARGDLKRIGNLKELLGRDPIVKHLEKPRLFLKMEISWESNSVRLSQKALAKRLLDEIGTAKSELQESSMSMPVVINEDDEVQPNSEEASKLQSTVGSLLYIH